MDQDSTLHFRDIEQGDKTAIEDFLRRYPTRKLNYCFQILYLWREVCEFQIEFYKDFLLIKTFIDCHHNFLYPLGGGDVGEVIEKMIRYAGSRRCPFRLFQLSAADRELLEGLFPEQFDFEEERGEAEYIYSSEKLASLAGAKMQHKRNHVNFFEQNYDWDFEPLTVANLSECREFNRQWFETQGKAGDLDDKLLSELTAIENAFAQWNDLGLDGALLRAGGEIVAYSAGCPLSKDTYLVLFEKSLHEVRGASQQINRLFVKTYAKGYTYVNRAEDGGDEGLRQAKLSYHPDIMENVYSAKLKTDRFHYDRQGDI